MCREASKKGKDCESLPKNFMCFQKWFLEMGLAIVNLVEFGINKETKALSIMFNYKKSFRNSSQPFLYVTIHPFDIESSSSSPSSSLSKELSLEKEGSESVSQSLKDDDDLEIASFTDDDSDDIPSNTSQTHIEITYFITRCCFGQHDKTMLIGPDPTHIVTLVIDASG